MESVQNGNERANNRRITMDSQMNGKQVDGNGEIDHSVNGNGKAGRGIRRASRDVVDLGKTGGISPPIVSGALA